MTDFGEPIYVDPDDLPADEEPTKRAYKRWPPILEEAARIVKSYDTRVTLRQLHYRLVAAKVGGYENSPTDYNTLSKRTAELRRARTFPELSDFTRTVEQPAFNESPAEALRSVAYGHHLDRTLGQEWQVWMLYEKSTLGAQIQSWTIEYGTTTAAFRGYGSESQERVIFERMDSDGRPIVAFYIGDIDPEGENIEQSFLHHADDAGIEFEHWERLAVRVEQIDEYGLQKNPGKPKSTRSKGFKHRHGSLFQVETEAIDPAQLEALVVGAVSDPDWFDRDEHNAVIKREARQRRRMVDFANRFSDDG